MNRFCGEEFAFSFQSFVGKEGYYRRCRVSIPRMIRIDLYLEDSVRDFGNILRSLLTIQRESFYEVRKLN